MSKKEELHKIWEANGNKLEGNDIIEAAKKLKLDVSSAYRYVRDFKGKRLKARISKTKGGGGIDKFRQLYDDSIIIPEKIEAGIVKCLVDKHGHPDWMYDREFREACGVPHNKWRRYADDFKHLQIRVNNLTIWGHPEIIEEMRVVIAR